MNMDATMRTVLVALLLAIALPVVYFFWKMPVVKLTPQESELIKFTSEPLVIATPRRQATFSGLDSPVRPEIKKPPPTAVSGIKTSLPGQFPAGNAASAARQPGRRITFDSRPAVSMIYCEGSIKIAIVDGHVLQEGSRFGKHQIVTIERTRVLMRTAGKDIWLKID